MHITIWADFVCPFCYIGETNLQSALADFPHKDQVTVEYKSFLLANDATYNPQESYVESFAKYKDITVDEANEALANVTRMGKNVGLNIDYDQAKHTSSVPAHYVFQYAKSQGKGNDFYSRLFQAYFEEGALISDEETLVRLAGEIALDEAGVRDSLADSSLTEVVNEDLSLAQSIGIQGVPFFVFDNKYAISGAQPKDSFRQALDDIWSKEHS